MARIAWILTAFVLSTQLSSCTPTFRAVRSLNLGKGIEAQALTADYRVITSQAGVSEPGKGPITCAEPSPDIARVFSQALSASASGATQAGLNVSGAVQFQTAQAIAELGKRTATIQLLRDVLHGECQAYANGLITRAEYAFKLSRFDGFAVTLMAIEMESTTGPAFADATLSSPSLSLSVQPNGQVSATSTKGGTSDSAPAPAAAQADPAAADKKASAGSGQASSDALAKAAKAVTDAKSAAAAATKAIGAADADLKAKGAKAADADKKAVSALDAMGKDISAAIDALNTAFLQIATDATATDSVSKDMTTLKAKLSTLTGDQSKQAKAIEAASITSVGTASKALTEAGMTLTVGQTAIQSVVDAQAPAKTPTSAAAAGQSKSTGTGLSDQQALAIRDIHETYLSLQNMIPLQIACVQAMDAPPSKPDAGDTAFRKYCQTYQTSIFGPVQVPASDIAKVSTPPRQSPGSTLPLLPPNRSYVFGPVVTPQEQQAPPAPKPDAPPQQQ